MSRVLPILFNTEMVTAILEGRKTVTRRIVKPQPTKEMKYTLGYCVMGDKRDVGKFKFSTREFGGGHTLYARPPVLVGDILWVRETWKCWRANRYEATADIMFKAGGENIRLYFANGNTDSVNRYDYDQFVYKWFGEKWHPSIHMPKEAARIWLKVTDVRVERICNMLQSDFLDEGIELYKNGGRTQKTELEIEYEFEDLWNSTVKKTGRNLYGWDANPWVWVIEFSRCKKPESQQF